MAGTVDSTVGGRAVITTRRPRASQALGRSGLALGRGLVLAGLAVAELVTLVLSVLAFLLWFGLGLHPAFILLTGLVRGLADRARSLAGSWSGVEVPAPYLPQPLPDRTDRGWYWSGPDYRERRWFAAASPRTHWMWTDPATWRDLLWLAVDPVVGGALALAPAAGAGYGLLGVGEALSWACGGSGGSGGLHYVGLGVDSAGAATLAGLLGVAFAVWGLAAADRLLRVHGEWTRALLAPTERARLAARVRQLTRTRADATESLAAELRRIERDLHDGAQARMVAMSLKLGAVGRSIDADPATARQLVAELQENSMKALAELRDLVRGIHPPVLAERGLADAVRALALDGPLEVAVDVTLPGRFDAAVESAMYFGVCEALANAARHAGAATAGVDISYVDGRLRAVVVDHGRGGADPSRGNGLRGIERRLGTFDGTLALISPPGGPTTVTMELPCALPSPTATVATRGDRRGSAACWRSTATR